MIYTNRITTVTETTQEVAFGTVTFGVYEATLRRKNTGMPAPLAVDYAF